MSSLRIEVQHFKAAHIGQPEVEDHAIAGVIPERRQRGGPGVGGDDFDVVVVEQFLDAHLFRRVVLDDQQPLAARLCVFLDLGQRRGDALGGGRLVHEGERAARQCVLAIFVECNDLDRNMPGQRVVLELAQHRPAEHVGQEHVERDRARLVLLGEVERLRTSCRDHDLEALVAREINQHPGVMRIIFDDQKDGVAGLQCQAIIRQLLDHALLRHDGHRRGSTELRGHSRPRRDRRSGILERQIEREHAAFAGRALQVDFATEQAGQLTADGEAKARATVFPAGAGVGLLEGFEDQLLLVLRNADAGV